MGHKAFITADGAAEVAFAAGSAKVVANSLMANRYNSRRRDNSKTPERLATISAVSHRRRGYDLLLTTDDGRVHAVRRIFSSAPALPIDHRQQRRTEFLDLRPAQLCRDSVHPEWL